MDIIVCTDNNFIMPTGIMLYSVCVNNKESDITFHVIIDNVSTDNKQKLQETVMAYKGKNIVFYDIDKIDISDIPTVKKGTRWSKAAYYRLYVTELLPSTINKVIYLDGDIIVRKSLLPLWEIDLNDFAVAAAPDVYFMEDSYFNRLKYPKVKGYFNSGVLVINLDYWRKNNLLTEFKCFMRQYAERIAVVDQDVLNYVLQDCKKAIPIKYNLQSYFLWSNKPYTSAEIDLELKEAINDCVVLHFTGPNPWQTTCRHPYRSTFFKYQSKTIWKDTPLSDNRPVKLRIIKFFSRILRLLKLIPELPPYSKDYLPNLKPID